MAFQDIKQLLKVTPHLVPNISWEQPEITLAIPMSSKVARGINQARRPVEMVLDFAISSEGGEIIYERESTTFLSVYRNRSVPKVVSRKSLLYV